MLFRKIVKKNWRTELKKNTLEFGVLYAKGVFVFIYKGGGCNWLNIRVSPDVYSVLLSGKNSEGVYFYQIF